MIIIRLLLFSRFINNLVWLKLSNQLKVINEEHTFNFYLVISMNNSYLFCLLKHILEMMHVNFKPFIYHSIAICDRIYK